MRRAIRWAAPVAYMMVIFYLSAQERPIPEVTERVWDKLLHFVEYGPLAILFIHALVNEGIAWRTAAVLALTMTSAYAATDEWHQAFVPSRNSNAGDWIADTLGAVLAVIAYVSVWLHVARGRMPFFQWRRGPTPGARLR